MRNDRWLIAALVVGALACPKSTLAQKTTVDPNAPGSRIEAQFEDSGDRLAEKVTLQIRRTSVVNILSVLSKQTGVDLRAGINQLDWQVRDRKMNIFCKDLPLSNLMNSIAQVMNFKWAKEKSKNGTYVYRLYMDRKTLLDAEAQAAREEDRRVQAETERRQRALDIYARVSEMSDPDLAKLRTENPMAYLFASSGLAKPMRGLFAESPSLLQALASGQSANIAAGSLSAQGQGYLADVWRGLHKMMTTVRLYEADLPSDLDSAVGGVTIKINPNTELMRNAPLALLGEIQIWQQDRRQMEFPIIDPESAIGELFGEAILEATETGKSMQDMERDMGHRLTAALTADLKADSAPEPEKVRPEDPALRAKVKIKPDSIKFEDVLSSVADASGIAVVSDSFRTRFVTFAPSNNEIGLQELLEKIGEGFRYDWDKPGSVIEFRDKKWFVKRAAQIPDAWIEAWREKLKKAETLELGDVAQICSLTPEQFDENVAEERLLLESGATVIYYTSKDIMRLYGSLTESQRAAAFTQVGLDLGSLSPEQWERAAKAITSGSPALLEEQAGPVLLTIETVRNTTFLDPPESSERRKRESIRWDFRIAAGDQGKEALWRVHAPTHAAWPNPRETKPKETGESKPSPEK